MAASVLLTKAPSPVFRRACRFLLSAVLGLPVIVPLARGSTAFTESFTGTTAAGWVFGANPGDTQPVLTANTVDSPGTGWLRLNTNTNNQSTFALLDTQIFSVNARIEIEMEYAFFNGTGADGITFFLVDGSVDSSTFAPGAYGGSMGYANRTGEAGMAGGYLGFALDTYGNYSNDEEGRNGGYPSGLRPNNVVVRGPESSGWTYIDDSGDLAAFDFNGAAPGGTGQSMAFYGSATRPDQSGANYRQFRVVLDANNQLSVDMRFGVGNDYVTVFESDLSAYERPETFKLGFTGATGGSTGIHEVRQLEVTSTPWSSGSGAYEWDHGAGTTTWGSSAGTEANDNWYSEIPGDDNKTPTPGSDILFGNKPASGPQTVNVANDVEVRNMTFDTPYDYTLDGAGTITFGDPGAAGLPSINVNNYNEANANGRHKINNDLEILENIAVRNYSYSTLCLNGDIDLGAHTLTTSGYGLTNLNGQITGSGPIVVNGASADPSTGQGIVTLSADNSATYTGSITVNKGQLVVLDDGALGDTGAATTVNDGGTLTFRGGVSTAENITIAGAGAVLGRGSGVALTEQAGAIYNDGGDNTLTGTVTLSADAAIGSRAGTLTISGLLTSGGGEYTLTKTGDGVVALSNTSNDWRADTRIEGGALRILTNFGSLPGGFGTNDGAENWGALILDGGVLEIGYNGTFTRSVGTGEEQVAWAGDGGFSAHGGDRTVTLSGGTMTWGAGSFVPTDNALLLSSDYADSTVTFTNAIDLGSAQREVRVADGSAALDGTLSGALTGTGGLIKAGDGTLSLSSGSNTYSGATEIRAGALRGNVSASSNTELAGGVRELSANYTGNLGSGAGEIRWTGSGGFSAETGTVTVNFGNQATLVWNSTSGFLTTGSTLVLGSGGAAGTIVLADALDLNGAERTIRVVDGSAATDARLDGVVSNGSLRLTGDGRLDTDTAHTLSGALTLVGAELRLAGGNNGQLDDVTAIELRQGGRLTIDNIDGNNNNRLNNALAITLAGGRLDYLGDDGGNSSETIGSVILSSGANTINIQRGDTDDRARFTTGALTRSAGATLDLTNEAGGGSFTGGNNDNPQFRVNPAATFDDGILAYATVNGSDFAGLTNTTYLTNYTGYDTGAETAWTSTADNAAPTVDQTLTAARTINSLKLADGIDVAQAGVTLTLQSGGLLSTGTNAVSISGGTLTTGNSNELIVHAYNSGGTTISSTITGTGGLTKSGADSLTLSGTAANTYTGVTTVNAGTLDLAKSDGVTAVAGDLTVGDGRGEDIVQISANEQIADTATVTLRGGEVGNDANRALLRLDGATDDSYGSRVESFATLEVTGNSVLDFGGGTPCSPTFLYLDVLNVAADALLTITNWIEFTDFLLVAKTTFESEDLSRVVFDGYGGAASWKDYDSDYYQIVPYAPVPEPATFGAFACGALTAFAALRRRRRRHA